MKIIFDPTKEITNHEKHGVFLSDAAKLDWDTVICNPDCRKDYGELREIGYGLISDRLYCVVFVRREEVVRIISFRKANQREVFHYVQQTQNKVPNS